MNHLWNMYCLDGGVRKVLGYTLYNQRLMNILNKISFHIFDSHVKKDPKGKGKMKDACIPICFNILNDFYRCWWMCCFEVFT